MNTTKTIITSIVATIVVVAIAFLAHSVSKDAPVQVAGGTSPEISSPYLIVNGVTEWYYQAAMRTASSTICSFAAPVSSSTIQYVSYDIQGNTNPNTLEIDISTTTSSANSGTTTSPLVANTIVTANTGLAQGFVASSFQSSRIYPGQGLNVVVATGTYATTPYAGYCQAEFTQY